MRAGTLKSDGTHAGSKNTFLLFNLSRDVWTFLRQEGSPDGSNRSRNQLCVGGTRIEINSLAGAKVETSGKLITGL